MKLTYLVLVSMLCSSFVSAKLNFSYAFDDYAGNTIIIYRNGDTFLFNVETKTDTMIFDNYSYTNPLGESSGYYYYGAKFWEKNPNSYITLYTSWSPIGDTDMVYHYIYGGVFRSVGNYLNNIFISQQNDSIAYISVKYYDYWHYSSDYGYTWQKKDPGFTLISVSPFNNNRLLGIESSSKYMVMSQNNGDTYIPVLSQSLNYASQYLTFFYDSDSLIIYFYDWDYHNSWDIFRSDDAGFSWDNIYTVANYCTMCLDESNSGVVYLANKNEIYISHDYGVSYQLYRTLNEPCTFLYKKPETDILYAGTDHYIFQVLPDTIITVKSILTSIEDLYISNIPGSMILKQNYPNPFNSITSIEFYLDIKSSVSMNIYDINGQLISNLFNEIKPAGFYRFQFNASDYSSGIYFYVLKNKNKSITKKLLLIK